MIEEGKMSLIFDFREISYILFNKTFTSCNFTNGKEIKIQTPFNRLIDLLPKDRFVCINDSIIINANEIKSIIKQDEKSKIIMRNKKIFFIDIESNNLLNHFQMV